MRSRGLQGPHAGYDISFIVEAHGISRVQVIEQVPFATILHFNLPAEPIPKDPCAQFEHLVQHMAEPVFVYGINYQDHRVVSPKVACPV